MEGEQERTGLPHARIADGHTPGGGDSHMKVTGDARRKIRINTLEETNLGVAPALFNP